MRIKQFLIGTGLAFGAIAVISACVSTATPHSSPPPSSPPAYSAPPAVATEGLKTLTSETTINMSQSDLRAWLLDNPFITFLQPTENISPPDTTEQLLDKQWYETGAVRRVQLADGHYVIERILGNEPERFKYQVWVFTNDAGRGIDQIIGEQNFIPVDDDTTKFVWNYSVKPKSAITAYFVNKRLPEIQRFMDSGVKAMSNAANQQASSQQ